MKTDLPYVQKFKDRHGKVRTYYRRNGMRQTIEGVPGSANWLSRYMRIHESFEAKASVVPDHETFEFAVQDYLDTSRFRSLAENSKSVYRRILDKLRLEFGSERVADFTRGDIIKIRDAIAARSPSKAMATVNVLRVVFDRACDIDTIVRNPAKGIRNPVGLKPKPHRKWTDAELNMFRERAQPHVRRAMLVLLHTGLRCSDALKLKRDVLTGNGISLMTQKTSAEVFIPISDELRSEFERKMPVESVLMIHGGRGQAMTRHGLLAMFRREFERLGIGKADQPTTHGLRKNAVVALIEAGAEEQSISAITGQSISTIRYYGQEYKRETVAMKVVPLLKKDAKT